MSILYNFHLILHIIYDMKIAFICGFFRICGFCSYIMTPGTSSKDYGVWHNEKFWFLTHRYINYTKNFKPSYRGVHSLRPRIVPLCTVLTHHKVQLSPNKEALSKNHNNFDLGDFQTPSLQDKINFFETVVAAIIWGRRLVVGTGSGTNASLFYGS